MSSATRAPFMHVIAVRPRHSKPPREGSIHYFWRYLGDHWKGHHGFAWSFWVNLVLLRVLLFALHEWFSPEPGQDFSDSRWLILVSALMFHGVVFGWQVVGVLRASEHHIRAGGSMSHVWAAQLAIVLAILWVMSYGLDAWQMTRPALNDLPSQAELNAERAAKYSIERLPGGRSLALTGSLELGITARLKSQLDAFPDVEQIVLASTGGNIYEARGLANTIRQRGLNTLVVSECSSACTTVFVGGSRRVLGPDAQLGFHQYWIDADYVVLNADLLREQNRDRTVFRQSGVADWFLDKMFDSDASDMWYPEIAELIDANVVTDIALPKGGN